MDQINRKMATGAAWMIGLKLTDNLLGLISTATLARLLLPADFGTVAMAMSIIALLELTMAFRFDLAIIQRQSVTNHHLDTAWTFSVGFGILTAVLLVALAHPVAAFYGEPRLVAIIEVLAFGWLVIGFENIGTVAFRKELEFGKEFAFTLSKRIVSFAVTIPLAFYLRNYWALVIGIVTGKVLSVLISFLVHPYRPRFSLTATRDLFNFSSWLLLNNVLQFANDRLSDFVIGRVSGARALGLYTVALETSLMPTTELVAPVNKAIFPGYVKLGGVGPAMRETYLVTLGLIALLALPAGAGVAALAAPIVALILGAQWADAVPLITVLGIYGAIASMGSNATYIYLALGRPQILTGLAIARGVVLLPALVACSARWGPLGAAWAMLGVELLYRPVSFGVLLRVIHLRARDLLATIWRPAVASLGMFLAVREFLIVTASGWPSFAQIPVGIVVGATVYAAAVLVLWSLSGAPAGAERHLLDQIGAALSHARSFIGRRRTIP